MGLWPFGTFAADELSLVFDRDPKENGLIFNRDRLTPETINIDGQDYAAWKSGYQSVPGDDWARSFEIKVTDPRFREGKRPLVDVEIVYCHEANTKVEVYADAGAGNVLAATAWGNQKKWQTIKFRLTNAYFGSRDVGSDPKKFPVDGYDLRINAAAGDFYLRSVKIVGYDVSEHPDYTELLKIQAVKASDGSFIAGDGKPKIIDWTIQNDALKGTATDWQVKLLDASGNSAREIAGKAALAASGASTVEATVPTAGLPAGFYTMEFRAFPPGQTTGKPWLEDSRQLVIPDPHELFILFDKEPVEHGLEFQRNGGTSAQTIPQGASTVDAWSASGGSSDEFPWARSWYFRVTDPKFQNGAQPAVDVEIVYRYEANAPVNVLADTADGAKQVSGGWGNNPAFQVIRFRLDNAYFGQRVPGLKNPQPGDKGYDIRLNAFNSDIAIRSIRIKGYDLADKPDWKRLALLEKISASKNIFAFARGEKDSIRFQMHNLAQKSVELAYTFTLINPDGVEMGTTNGTLPLGAGQTDAISYPVETDKLPYGVYTIRLKTDANDGAERIPLYTNETSFAVHSPAVLPKAKDGEFFYGLDVAQGTPTDDPAFIEWATLMGTDIFRNGGPAITDFDGMDRALALYDKAGLRTQMMPEPRFNADPAQKDAAVAQLASQAEAFAARYKGKVTYYELGNEPDLTFFYPGPIEDYIKGFTTLSDGIKKGNPDARVMNGGLAFFGDDGYRRAKTLVQTVPKSQIDILAYHGHGPGAEAERTAYERIAALTKGTDKDGISFVDTESGFAAKTPRQERVQARTAIEKLVFAQSVGSPVFYWFRLFFTGSEASYSSLKTTQEPRPVVLAYRTTVEMLRGYRFSKSFDFGEPGVEGYLFKKIDGPGNVLVAWSAGDTVVYHTLQFPAGQGVETTDLFGNRTTQPSSSDGVASLGIGPDPVFISWAGPGDEVKVVPSLIVADPMVNLLPGVSTTVQVKLRNPGATASSFQLGYEIGGSDQKGTQDITLKAGEEAATPVKINLDASQAALAWPQNWLVYMGFKEGDIDPSSFKQIPQSLSLGGKELTGRLAPLQDHVLNLAALAGTSRERDASLAFAEVDSPSDQTVPLGASADWWMACYVNGVKALDTLDTGNQGGYSIDDHVFQAKLKKGPNLIAFLVLSGSQGWKLLTGGPAELEKEKMGAGGPPEIKWTLRKDGAAVAHQTSGLRFVQPLPERQKPVQALTAEAWLKEPRTSILDPSAIKNFFEPFPDSSKWYQGENDLSGSLWIGLEPAGLAVVVDVVDDVDHPADKIENVAKSDSVDLALLAEGGKLAVLRVARVAGAVAVTTREGADLHATATVDRLPNQHTLYRISIPRTSLSSGAYYTNLRVNDADGDDLKQTLTWRPGWSENKPDPRMWNPIVLP